MPDRTRKGLRNRALRQELERLAQENQSLPQPIIRFSSWEGPVPPPEALQQYGNIDPAFPKMIIELSQSLVEMAIDQAAHRQSIETKVVDGGLAAQKRGQYMAYSLALVVIGIGSFLIWNGKSTHGIVAIVTALGGLLTVFLYGRRKTAQERSARFKGLMKKIEKKG